MTVCEHISLPPSNHYSYIQMDGTKIEEVKGQLILGLCMSGFLTTNAFDKTIKKNPKETKGVLNNTTTKL